MFLNKPYAVISAFLMALCLGHAKAAPEAFRPADLTEIVSPASPTRATVSADPLPQIRAMVSAARAGMDPRLYGRAGALVEQALSVRPGVPDLLTLRAVIAQADHRFPDALADLATVLAMQPGDAQARLSRAFIFATLGRLDEAENDCSALAPRVGDLIRTVCFAHVRGLRGDYAAAARGLARALSADRNAPPEVRAWAHSLTAGILARAGDPGAGHHFAEATRLAPDDQALALRHASFLRETGNPRAALRRLGDSQSDGAVLERAIAKRALGQPATAEVAVLEARFSRQSGSRRHLREEARFRLSLQNQPVEALRLARLNWQIQKEPEDLALLTEAEAAVGLGEQQ